MSVKRIASRYAKALMDLAFEQNKLEEIHKDVKAFKEAAQNRDFYLLIKSPIVPKPKKTAVLHALFGKAFDKVTLAFLDILVRKGREAYLPEIAGEFFELYRAHKKITALKITSASPLSEELVKALISKLQAHGAVKENVELETKIDPTLIGGFVVETEGKIIDTSVQQSLKQLRHEFKDNLYISQIVAG